MKFKRRLNTDSRVDLIPMIDVVFQLILFFLVSTTFALLPGITLNLPESDTSESTVTSGIIITAEQNGTLWVNQEPVSLDELESALAAFPSDEREAVPVTLEADELITNGTIVRILDALRRTGFAAVNLRTTAVH
ncbi:MAG: biopolymer transporter ExbD [Spirochaetaceae bacterium]|jgi:biopolymer transport protein ExbD|nr:biopolymer transporter ExbD [Spirochaetaceae bacterium]